MKNIAIRIINAATLTLLSIGIALCSLWGALALAYLLPVGIVLRNSLVAGFIAISLAALILLMSRHYRWRALACYAIVFLLLITWWRNIEPSNDRNWQADVAVLPYATIDDNIVTVHNIRNFGYRNEFDYIPAYYDERFDINKLEGVDLIASYWMGPAIAHVFLSFAFADGHHLAISIETRKEKGEGYSTIKGFFRHYELYYVVADERDVIRLRTNYRRDPPEDVYLYRLKAPIENARRVFLEYMHEINLLKVQPAFYNTLTTNCTTSIWLIARVNPQHVPLNWKVFASGYLPAFLYERGKLESHGLSFAELQRQAHINARAKIANDASDFSQRIREAGPTTAMNYFSLAAHYADSRNEKRRM